MLKVGDKVTLNGCPYDEQIPGEEAKYERLKQVVQTVTEVTEWEKGHFLVKTDKEPELIDQAWHTLEGT